MPARRTGRPAKPVYSPEEVADLCELPVAIVLRHLRAPGRSFFPGAWEESDGHWRVPEDGVRAFMGRRIERHYSLQSVAELLELSYDHVWRTVKAQRLAVEVAGTQRVPESAILKLISRKFA